MTLKNSLVFVAFAFATLTAMTAQSTPKNQFNKKNMEKSWVTIIKNPALKATDLFHFDQGTLKISDKSTGYIRSKKKYTDFILNVEYRWTNKAGNSGVLVYIQPQDSIWPQCYQVQQKSGSAGDVLCMNGLKAKECTDTLKFTVKKIEPASENPTGEWNRIQIICKSKTMTVFINDTLQNQLTGLSASKGYIGFQAEGQSIEFKNLIIQ